MNTDGLEPVVFVAECEEFYFVDPVLANEMILADPIPLWNREHPMMKVLFGSPPCSFVKAAEITGTRIDVDLPVPSRRLQRYWRQRAYTEWRHVKKVVPGIRLPSPKRRAEIARREYKRGLGR